MSPLPDTSLVKSSSIIIASANVETVFVGADEFTEEAPNTRPTFLRRIVKLHYDYKYPTSIPSFALPSRRLLSAMH